MFRKFIQSQAKDKYFAWNITGMENYPLDSFKLKNNILVRNYSF